MKVPRVERIVQMATIAFVVAVLLSEALLYLPGAEARASVTVEWTVDANRTLEADVTIGSTYSGHFTATALSRHATERTDQVFFFFDARFPFSFSDLRDWYGLSQHMAVVAAARGLSMQIELVNATQLASVLQRNDTHNDTVVFASGVLPDSVFSPSVDYLDPWIHAGGLVVWAGDRIGAYSGGAGGTLVCGNESTLAAAGTARILNVSWLAESGSGCGPSPSGPPPVLFLNGTTAGTELGMSYPYGIIGSSFSVPRLLAGGGLVLGGTRGNWTNVAYIPLGAGGLLDFDGPATDSVRLSVAIDDAWQSGILVPGTPAPGASDSFTLTGGSSGSARFWFPEPPGTLGSCVFVAQTDFLATFATESCAPTSGAG